MAREGEKDRGSRMERGGGRQEERGERRLLLFSVLSGSSVQTCCSVESEPSSSDSYP